MEGVEFDENAGAGGEVAGRLSQTQLNPVSCHSLPCCNNKVSRQKARQEGSTSHMLNIYYEVSVSSSSMRRRGVIQGRCQECFVELSRILALFSTGRRLASGAGER